MLSSHLALHRRLDDLALDALGPPPPLPVARVPEYEVSIEIVYEDEAAVVYEDEAAIDELAATNQFVRFSAPYERMELAELEDVPSLAELSARPATFARRKPTRFARTITVAQRAITANERTAVEAAAAESMAAEDDGGSAATRRMAADDDSAATRRMAAQSMAAEDDGDNATTTRIAAKSMAADADGNSAATRRMAAAEYPSAPASATVPFERVWFDDDEDRLAAIEEKPVEIKASWKWLAISIVAGGAAVAFMALAAG